MSTDHKTRGTLIAEYHDMKAAEHTLAHRFHIKARDWVKSTMAENDFLKATLERVKKENAELLEKLRSRDSAVRMVSVCCGVPEVDAASGEATCCGFTRLVPAK